MGEQRDKFGNLARVSGSHQGRSAVLRATAAAMLAPFLVLILRAPFTDWSATGDNALIEVRTHEVGTSHTPLIGPYSRFGWSHPGPALFYVLALPYRVFSSHANGLLAGAAIISVGAAVAIAVAVLRSPLTRLGAVFALSVSAVLIHALGATFAWNPWNPYVIVFPLLAFVVLSWWVATGEDRALPVAVAFASFVIQTHVSLVPEAVALLALALGWLITSTRGADMRRLRRSLLLSIAVLVVMWLPPIVQQFQPAGGNLGALLRFWTAAHRTLGLSKAARLLAPQFAIPAPWMTGHDFRANPFTSAPIVPPFSFPFALALLLIAAAVAWRRRDRVGLAACSIAGTAVLVAWLSLSRIVGEPYRYLIRWTWVVGATCWLASGIVLLPAITNRFGRVADAWLSRAVYAATLLLLGLLTVQACMANAPDAAHGDVVHALVAEALPRLRALPGPFLVATDDPSTYEDVLRFGVIGTMVEHGIDARWPTIFVSAVGRRDTVTRERARTVLLIASGSEIAGIPARYPANRQIARYATGTSVTALFVIVLPP